MGGRYPWEENRKTLFLMESLQSENHRILEIEIVLRADLD